MEKKELANVANEVNALHEGIAKKYRLCIEDACKIGRLLLEIKPKVQFKKWIKANCSFTHVQARRYMRAAEWVDEGHEPKENWTLTELYKASGSIKEPTPKLKTGSGVSGSKGSVASQSGKIVSLIRKGKASGGYICNLPKNSEDWTACIGELSVDPRLAIAIEAGLVLRKGA